MALYQYMRLRGYPAERISILTTYNGQKALIQDVVERRCVGHPAFGRPLKVGWGAPGLLDWQGSPWVSLGKDAPAPARAAPLARLLQ